jgi:hypothetical protein
VTDPIGGAASLAFAVGIIGLLVTALGAVPVVLWLIRHGRLSLFRLVIAGAILGNLPFTLIVLGILAVHLAEGSASSIGRFWYGWAPAARLIVIGVAHGVVSAVLFWAVAVRGAATRARP